MIAYEVRHETVYSYADTVAVSHNVAHLLPRERPGQRLDRIEFSIDPTPSTIDSFVDYFGNPVVFFVIDEPHERLRVHAESRVEVVARPVPDLAESPPWERVVGIAREARDPAALEALEFVFDSPFVVTSAALRDYAIPSFAGGRPVLDAAFDLCRRIHREFRYDPEATTLATPVHEALEQRHGVCQDFAHVMVGSLRSLGVPARYVSGYIRSRAPKASAPVETEEKALVGADASHAWVSVFCPESGWIDFDPTNDMLPTDRHVTLGFGRDYDDVSPLQGVTLGGGLQTVSVAVDVQPVEEVVAPG